MSTRMPPKRQGTKPVTVPGIGAPAKVLNNQENSSPPQLLPAIQLLPSSNQPSPQKAPKASGPVPPPKSTPGNARLLALPRPEDSVLGERSETPNSDRALRPGRKTPLTRHASGGDNTRSKSLKPLAHSPRRRRVRSAQHQHPQQINESPTSPGLTLIVGKSKDAKAEAGGVGGGGEVVGRKGRLPKMAPIGSIKELDPAFAALMDLQKLIRPLSKSDLKSMIDSRIYHGPLSFLSLVARPSPLSSVVLFCFKVPNSSCRHLSPEDQVHNRPSKPTRPLAPSQYFKCPFSQPGTKHQSPPPSAQEVKMSFQLYIRFHGRSYRIHRCLMSKAAKPSSP